MSKITINTFLRPAILSDVFENQSKGVVFEDKQFFYQQSNGSVYGPHRITNTFNAVTFNSWYLEILQLLSESRLLIVDPVEYSESIAIELELQKVYPEAILQNNTLITHTAYFLKNNTSVDGPFYIKKNTTKQDLKTRAHGKKTFVFSEPMQVKVDFK